MQRRAVHVALSKSLHPQGYPPYTSSPGSAHYNRSPLFAHQCARPTGKPPGIFRYCAIETGDPDASAAQAIQSHRLAQRPSGQGRHLADFCRHRDQCAERGGTQGVQLQLERVPGSPVVSVCMVFPRGSRLHSVAPGARTYRRAEQQVVQGIASVDRHHRLCLLPHPVVLVPPSICAFQC